VNKVKQFTVSDGKMVLTLEPADEGGYLVTSPFDPELVTEAETIEEAFEMARDAAEGLRKVRAKLFGRPKKRAAKRA
jgi:predicted RNase H-like HicB family nuclease